MRRALPNAAFIGFTGTPLMAEEEKTRDVFGDYVSTYTYQQSTEDGATVPLYYENRIPELQFANEAFADNLEALIDKPSSTRIKSVSSNVALGGNITSSLARTGSIALPTISYATSWAGAIAAIRGAANRMVLGDVRCGCGFGWAGETNDMRPNWLTIAIVPALCAALVGAGVTWTLLWYSTPLRTISGEAQSKPVVDTKAGMPSAKGTPNSAPGAAPPTDAAASRPALEAGFKSASPPDKPDKDVTPWWGQLSERLVWPLTLLTAMCFVAYNPRLGRIFGFGTRLVKKITAGGVQIEINSETVELVQRQLHGTFQELITGAAEEYERIAEIQDVPTLLKNAIVANALTGAKGLRGTIHVNDVIFPDYLYQLVDYYPRGGGAHRRFSQRYGIIGRSWRSKTSHGTGDAFAGAGSVEALVENWGMTEEEAQGQVNARPACLSVIVRYHSIPMGILFIDSVAKDAFGDDAAALALAQKIEKSPAVTQLGEALSRTLAPLRTAAPSLKIKGPAG
jgi:hypothetical protein